MRKMFYLLIITSLYSSTGLAWGTTVESTDGLAVPPVEEASPAPKNNQYSEYGLELGETGAQAEPAPAVEVIEPEVPAVIQSVPADEITQNLPQEREIAPKESSRMRTLLSDCSMYKEMSSSSATLNTLPKGRKVWTVPANDSWYEVYRADGSPAYVQKFCF